MVELPHFVAGIIDSRGVFSQSEQQISTAHYDYTFTGPKLYLASKNVGLIKALQNRFGGSVYHLEKGAKIEIFGKAHEVTIGSAKLQLNTKQIDKLMKFVSQELVLTQIK